MKLKKIKIKLRSILFRVKICYHSRFNPKCKTERGFKNQLNIEMGCQGLGVPQILKDLLTLPQPEGADYAHQMILAPPALLCINKSNASKISYSCNNITRG